MQLTLWFLKHYRTIWWSLFILSALPFIHLILDYHQQQLGDNPLQTLTHTTGHWALIFLLITLAITPMRQLLVSFCIYIHTRFGKRLEDWNWIIRLRRMLGLYTFFYATLHMLVYILFDAALNLSWIMSDVREKPYIALGIFAFVLLVPLAITSHSKVFMLIGKDRWQRLHRTVYLILIIVLTHFWWQSKVGVYAYLPYTAVSTFLLGFRLFNWLGILRRNPRDDGLETEARD